MNARKMVGFVAVMLLLAAGAVQADVFNMGGTRDPATGTWTGLASLETVPVGNPGNVGENSGCLGPDLITHTPDDGYGPYGENRICGAVSYEYKIGKYEVTAGQYTEFLNSVADTDTYNLYSNNMWLDSYGCKIQRTGSSGSYTYSVASDYANRPVNYVSWGDSARFANWLHNGQPTGAQGDATTEDGAYDLNGATTNGAALMAVTRKAGAKWAITSEDEWYKAAYYKGGGTNAGYWDYPTSSNTAPGQDKADTSGNNANYYTSPYAYPIDSGKHITVVGEFQNSDSPYGTFDQGGNVWEWNEAIVYMNSDWSTRRLRGGSFESDFHAGNDLQAATRYSLGYGPGDAWRDMGFRVSEVPETVRLTAYADGPYTISPGDMLDLNASGSIDPNSTITSYMWDLNGDGIFETDAGSQSVFQVNFAYIESFGLEVGLHGIELQVTNALGLTDTDGSSLTIIIIPEPATLSLLALGGLALIRRRSL